MDFEALYKHRFRNVDQEKRNDVWTSISEYIYEIAGRPKVVLDPACGLGEFINSIPAQEKWALDLGIDGSTLNSSIEFKQISFLESELPKEYFDLIFVSNVLEHMPDQFAVNRFLVQARSLLKQTGVLIVMGPNFKYCAKEYFDCADHFVPLTHISVVEHLSAAGYEVTRTAPRFLPYSFRSRLPASQLFTKLYLRFRYLWPLLGKQFLIVASVSR